MFTPYIEAPSVRTTVQPASGGITTSTYDHLRQGISIRNNYDRFGGSLPTLGSNRDNHEIDLVTYGQPPEFSDDPTWEQVDLFDAVTYIQSNVGQSIIVEAVNDTILDPESAGGFIEPLPLPARSLRSVGGPDLLRGTHGSIVAGNEDIFQKTEPITQFFVNDDQVQINDLYIDSSDRVGTDGGDITIPGFFPESERLIRPFDETMVIGKTYESGSTSADSGVIAALLAMTGTSTDNYVFKSISMNTGFTYTNTPSGVDSISFGGLKR